MDQESNSKSGSRGSWRDRLGITDDGTSKSEAGSSSAAAPSTKPAPVGGPKVVAKPAPMAPRPGAAAKAPVRAAPATADQATSPAKPKPEAERPQAAAGQKDDAFAERLRQHRAAAEEAVKKRSASPGLEKFSFAKKEVETARAESAPSSKPVSPNRPAPANKAAAPAARPAAPVRTAVSSPAQTGSAAQRPSVPTATTGSVAAGAGTRNVAAGPRPAQYGARSLRMASHHTDSRRTLSHHTVSHPMASLLTGNRSSLHLPTGPQARDTQRRRHLARASSHRKAMHRRAPTPMGVAATRHQGRRLRRHHRLRWQHRGRDSASHRLPVSSICSRTMAIARRHRWAGLHPCRHVMNHCGRNSMNRLMTVGNMAGVRQMIIPRHIANMTTTITKKTSLAAGVAWSWWCSRWSRSAQSLPG